jgi:hypothetical protein
MHSIQSKFILQGVSRRGRDRKRVLVYAFWQGHKSARIFLVK